MDKPEDKKNYKEIAKANKDLVRRLSEIHCSLAEISHITGISKGTLEKKYSSEIDQGKANGTMGLRRTQMTRAMDGDPRMLIFLGKNLLGQSENPNGGDDSTPLPWTDEDI
jgi:hypothetical protein